MKRQSVGLFGVVLLIGSTGFGTVAHAATVACGQVITQDTVLDTDVGPCPGNGIIIGASNITLDLGGHTIFGSPSTPTPPYLDHLQGQPSNFNGIFIDRPYSGVVIRNGSVRGFGDGVTVYRSSGNTLERLVAGDNRCNGIRLQGTQYEPATNNLVRENVVTRNGCAGIGLRQSTQSNTVERNAVFANAGPGVRVQPAGFLVNGSNNRVRHNHIHQNGADGVEVWGPALFIN
ncbi:MAG: right-handed parallel beta-helix repeat-containing protein, partial [Actinomycetota bacterium]|nr:right-handed parallel beta-helix repeat-containing protein [Actinomycetota bacterium]